MRLHLRWGSREDFAKLAGCRMGHTTVWEDNVLRPDAMDRGWARPRLGCLERPFRLRAAGGRGRGCRRPRRDQSSSHSARRYHAAAALDRTSSCAPTASPAARSRLARLVESRSIWACGRSASNHPRDPEMICGISSSGPLYRQARCKVMRLLEGGGGRGERSRGDRATMRNPILPSGA